ncbi:MAG: hypothetical protein M1837_002743 [Sclerophora amabilis]|nr:MAG: hypothetical protein M1837_002743 [Sclerophora amabilis]
MPPRGLRKQPANQHNHRHENGLAPPGKKVERDRINTHKLNGHLNGGCKPPAPPPPLAESSDGSSSENKQDDDDMAGLDGRESRESEASDYVEDAFQNGTSSFPLGANGQQSHRSIDVTSLSSTTEYRSRSRGVMELSYTILRSCPLGDSIAVLIILLQIPPIVLTIIQFLFATLTLIPPYIQSIASLSSLTNILSGSVGNPSLTTIVTADIVFLTVWLLLWTPAQNFTVDFAQAVIAVSLGSGRHNGRGGSARNAIICIGVIILCHAAKRKGFRLSGLSLFSSPLPPTPTKVASFISQPESFFNRASHGWSRSILAVHITTQGIVRSVRWWLVARTRVNTPQPTKKAEPEVAAHLQSQPDAKSSPERTNFNPSTATDSQCTTSASNFKAVKEKPPRSKTKRRKGVQVRNEQPIWAALASIKVTALNSYEQSQATAVAVDAKATDVNNLGSAPFYSQDSCIWITHVGSTDVRFSSSLCSTQQDSFGEGRREDGSAQSVSGRGKSNPFLVRVNGTLWTSVNISTSDQKPGNSGEFSAPLSGEVFGLAPLSNYHCEFVSSADHQQVIFATTFTTQQALSTLTASVSPTASISQKTLRPSSPTTTLKNSITTAEATLHEERTRQKRIRKDHKSSSNSLKKEVDSSSSRLTGSGGGDDRHRQRVLQLRQNIRQAHEVIEETASQIGALGSIPEEDSRTWERSKAGWEEGNHELSDTKTKLKDEKSEADRRTSTIESEAGTTTQKRERLQARLNKLIEQHDRIVNAQAQGLTSKEQKAAEQFVVSQRRQVLEQGYLTEIGNMQASIKHTTYASQQLWQQIHAIETSVREIQQQQIHQQMITSSPTTAEGSMPGSQLGPTSSTMAHESRLGNLASLSSVQSQYPTSAAATATASTQPSSFARSRGRSSSLLSNASGTNEVPDFKFPSSPSTADAIPNPIGSHAHPARTISHCSDEGGSGSSGSGSQGDPMSPVGKRSSPLSANNSSISGASYPWT